MTLYNLIVSDPAWPFSDKLAMSKTKRSAESQYSVMTDDDIINLKVKDIIADDAVLLLWVPSSKLDVGLKCLNSWGFKLSGTWIWVKTKQNPLNNLQKVIFKIIKQDKKKYKKLISDYISSFNMNDILNFFMGHLFRQTHELCLVGTRGKYTKLLKNKSQRSVFIGPALKPHSKKPEELQNRLDIMFPDVQNKLEMFARRDRPGWTCTGWECPSTWHCDIRDEIERLAKLP